jgi:hypothetical protein
MRMVHHANISRIYLFILRGPVKFCRQQVETLRFVFLHAIHEKHPAIISGIAVEPSKLLKIFLEFVHRADAGLNLNAGEIALHVAGAVDKEIRFRVRIRSCTKSDVLLCQPRRHDLNRSRSSLPEPGGTGRSNTPDPDIRVFHVRNRQLEIRRGYARRRRNHPPENLELFAHGCSGPSHLNVTLIRCLRASRAPRRADFGSCLDP